MPVLRSGNVTSPANLKKTPKSLENGCSKLSTPVKTPEILNQKTVDCTPSLILLGDDKELVSGSGGKVVSRAGSVWRRSPRLAVRTGLGSKFVEENVDHSSRKKKYVSQEDSCQLGNDDNISVGDGESNVLSMSGKRVRVTEEIGEGICHTGDIVPSPAKGVEIKLEKLLGSEFSTGQSGERLESGEKGKGKRTILEVDFARPKESDMNLLNLRSGKRRSKRTIVEERSDLNETFVKDKQVVVDTDSEGEENGKAKRTGMEVDFAGPNENERMFLNLRSGKRRSNRLKGDERNDLNESESPIKDTQVVVGDLSPVVLEQNSEHGVGKVNGVGVETISSFSKLDDVRENFVDNNVSSNGSDTLERRLENGDGVKPRNRLSRLDKGKQKVAESDYSIGGFDASGSMFEHKAQKTTEHTVLDGASPVENVTLQEDNNVPAEKSFRERFRELAKQNASRFAHFVPEEEDNKVSDGSPGENSAVEDGNIEDWPGPFSTAMKIIKDRETNKKIQQQNSSIGKSKALPKWIPKRNQQFNCRKSSVPSLQDLCWPILVNNAESITSLDFIPDVLKHKLTQLLCDRRQMNSHILELLVRGSPTEIRVRECSWLTEESFSRVFEQCDTSNLTVLQLDLCGCCLADYILYTTFACSPNSLPALTTISLKGAYRISDAGLSTLVTSAPSLRSINLSQCSLLTSDGIKCLADSLGHVLRELYISECQDIDAKLILPALLNLQNLEVLSVASIESVDDNFVIDFVTARGHNMKELILKDCMKLTDSSVRAIAQNCSKLCSIDLSNLRKLTDAALGYIANGCRAIHTLKLGRNLFSDEAVAAYIEICGDSLKELSLNYVTQIADNTAVSLAKCSKLLHTLDLSFCRNISNEDLGLIVDSCSSLRVLKLFGCSQVRDVFLCGHSNPHVEIIGLKMTSVFQHLKDPVLPQGLPPY